MAAIFFPPVSTFYVLEENKQELPNDLQTIAFLFFLTFTTAHIPTFQNRLVFLLQLIKNKCAEKQ